MAYGLPPVTAPALVVAAVVLIGVALTSDAGGRIAGGIAAVLLLLGAGWASHGPTLVADPSGVTVRGAFRRRHLHWTDIVSVRADDRRRTRAVEFETVTGLVVVPASLLGRDTAGEVVEAVSALRDRLRPETPGHSS